MMEEPGVCRPSKLTYVPDYSIPLSQVWEIIIYKGLLEHSVLIMDRLQLKAEQCLIQSDMGV